MQMKEKICLTGLLLGTNHGCSTTNPNQSVLQCNGNIPVEPEVREWLRKQSKDFYTTGFDELVKRWDQCINVGGGYVEK
jgi:hypothetical protein